jgi:hypothetical protein
VVNAIRRVCAGYRPRPERGENLSRVQRLRGFLRNAGTSTVLPRHFHRVVSGNQVRRQPGGSRAAKARNGQRT